MIPNYAVSFVFARSAARLDFMFEAFKNADELYKKAVRILACPEDFTPEDTDVEDDFECRARIKFSTVSAVMFNNLNKERTNQVNLRLEGDKQYSKAVQVEQRRPNLATPSANALQV